MASHLVRKKWNRKPARGLRSVSKYFIERKETIKQNWKTLTAGRSGQPRAAGFPLARFGAPPGKTPSFWNLNGPRKAQLCLHLGQLRGFFLPILPGVGYLGWGFFESAWCRSTGLRSALDGVRVPPPKGASRCWEHGAGERLWKSRGGKIIFQRDHQKG